MVPRVGNIYIADAVLCCGYRTVQSGEWRRASVRDSPARYGTDGVTGVNLSYSLICSVGDVEIPGSVYCYAGGAVQRCAGGGASIAVEVRVSVSNDGRDRAIRGHPANSVVISVGDVRSEERRVGKEGRSRWSPY